MRFGASRFGFTFGDGKRAIVQIFRQKAGWRRQGIIGF
jgi:hypothetical protein